MVDQMGVVFDELLAFAHRFRRELHRLANRSDLVLLCGRLSLTDEDWLVDELAWRDLGLDSRQVSS